MIAALYVAPGGCYWDLEDVEPWGCRSTPEQLGACEPPERDARLYNGPWPVVAHPPCARWGRYWSGGPSAKEPRELGDDGGCFAAALASVRRWGGVIEHPEASHAWRVFGLVAPDRFGGWTSAGDFRGWTCCVEQGHYGHRARKATWLYAVGCSSLPSLRWGPSCEAARMDLGFHSAAERKAFYANSSECGGERKTELMSEWESATGMKHFRRLTRIERMATPPAFRDMLLDIARSCR